MDHANGDASGSQDPVVVTNWPPKELHDIAMQVQQGQQPSVTVRNLLSWFHAQRRGTWIVSEIQNALRELKLRTIPDFSGAFIDGPITFEARDESVPESDYSSGLEGPGGGPITATDTMVAGDSVAVRTSFDPTYRIGRLGSANRAPVAVAPDATIEHAITTMLARDFSQLPVMTSERDVKGMFSWKSLAGRLALGTTCQCVRDCMDRHYEITDDTSLFEAINLIVEHECVLVRSSSQKICGIVTTSDLSLQFRQLTEPFLLLSEIENQVRRIIGSKFTKDELQAIRDPEDPDRKVQDVTDLTFGEYQRLLENPSRWEKLNLRIDRGTFIKSLEDIRRVRNDVMHFDPDGIGEDDLAAIRLFVQFLQRLRDLAP